FSSFYFLLTPTSSNSSSPATFSAAVAGVDTDGDAYLACVPLTRCFYYISIAELPAKNRLWPCLSGIRRMTSLLVILSCGLCSSLTPVGPRLLTEFSCSPLSFNSFLTKQTCFSSATAPLPWIFVGLGNPVCASLVTTTHPVQVGFEMIDAFAASVGIPMDTVHCKALFGKGFVGNIPVFLAKPQTYMNLSGESMLFFVVSNKVSVAMVDH
ncbi:hypothetical protein S245_023803, partial [Arachis hypogaea]